MGKMSWQVWLNFPVQIKDSASHPLAVDSEIEYEMIAFNLTEC